MNNPFIAILLSSVVVAIAAYFMGLFEKTPIDAEKSNTGSQGTRESDEVNDDDNAQCCEAMTADCLACASGQTKEVYCTEHPQTDGCGRICCQAMTADCLSCASGQTKEAYCAEHPQTDGCNDLICCRAMTASCLACAAGQTVEDYCTQRKVPGCPNPPSGVPPPTRPS